MTPPLYSPSLLALAKKPAGAASIPRASASAVRDNPLCGDECRISLSLASDGSIASLAHDTRACAVCRASASLLASHLPGLPPDDARALVQNLFDALASDDFSLLPPPFAVFRGISAYPSRIHCARLPAETLLATLP